MFQRRWDAEQQTIDVGSEAEMWWGDINEKTNSHFKKAKLFSRVKGGLRYIFLEIVDCSTHQNK